MTTKSISMCAWCKCVSEIDIITGNKSWRKATEQELMSANISHGVCPICKKNIQKELDKL